MSEDFARNVGKLFGGLKRKAEETLAKQQAAFVLGKVPGVDVSNDFGVVLAKAGVPVTQQILSECERAGRLGALASAVAKGVAQDLTETAKGHMGALPENREQRSVDDLDDYLAARAYIGATVGLDVTDMRGNVLLSAGTTLVDEHIRMVRDSGQLGALLYAVKQPYTPQSIPVTDVQPVREAPKPTMPETPGKRTTLPMPPPSQQD